MAFVFGDVVVEFDEKLKDSLFVFWMDEHIYGEIQKTFSFSLSLLHGSKQQLLLSSHSGAYFLKKCSKYFIFK